MLYAGGNIVLFNSNIVKSVRPASITISKEVEELEAIGFPFDPGPAQVVDSANGRETYTGSLTLQSIDKLDLGLILNTQLATTTISLPEPTKITVPSTSPYTVTVTGLTLDQSVQAQVLSEKSPMYLTQATYDAGTPATGTFEVAADTLHFHADQAGDTVAINYLKTYADVEIYGGNTASLEYTDMAFYGMMLGTRTDLRIYIKKMTMIGNFELAFAGEASEIEMGFKLVKPEDWNRPYAIVPVMN